MYVNHMYINNSEGNHLSCHCIKYLQKNIETSHC